MWHNISSAGASKEQRDSARITDDSVLPASSSPSGADDHNDNNGAAHHHSTTTFASLLGGYDTALRSASTVTRIAFPFDRFKATMHDPRSVSVGSALTSLVWYAAVAAFAAVAIHQHLRRPEVTNLTLMEASQLPALTLTLHSRCSEGWACTPGAQPLPSAAHAGPCRYQAPYNRTYACAKHAANVLTSSSSDDNPAGRRLLHDHMWTWGGTVSVTQRYAGGGGASKCAAHRTVVADSWGAEFSELDLTNASAVVDADALARYAADTNATVDALFAALDADGSGGLAGADELSVFGPFAAVMLALNNFGDYHEGNVTFAGGYKDINEMTAVEEVLAAGDVGGMDRFLLGFGVNCTSCTTVADYRATLTQTWEAVKAGWLSFVETNPDAHPWRIMLDGDAWYNQSVGIDGFPKDGVVTREELREAIRYMLLHRTITPWGLAQAAQRALNPCQPLAAKRAPLQLCAPDVAAGDHQLGGLLLETDFPDGCPYGATNCNTRLTVTLGATVGGGDGGGVAGGGMHLAVDLEPSQRKAVQIGVTVRRRTGRPAEDRYELRVADMYYVGKNDDRRASLRVGLKQYAEVVETSRPGDFLSVFAAVGGFASLALSLLGLALSTSSALQEGLSGNLACLGDCIS